MNVKLAINRIICMSFGVLYNSMSNPKSKYLLNAVFVLSSLQRITGSLLGNDLRMFGQSVSGGVDIDSNNYPGNAFSTTTWIGYDFSVNRMNGWQQSNLQYMLKSHSLFKNKINLAEPKLSNMYMSGVGHFWQRKYCKIDLKKVISVWKKGVTCLTCSCSVLVSRLHLP